MRVRITGTGTVLHDGKEYRRGDEIPDITIAHAARLVELGCAEYVAPEPPAEPPENYTRPEPIAPVDPDAEPEPEVETETETEPESTPNYTRPRRGRRKRNA